MTENTHNNVKIDDDLVHATVKLNTRLFALVLGLLCGGALFVLTRLSLISDQEINYGSLLNLLGIFMPGYEVSAAGSWLGLLWGAVIGALIGAIIYRIYAATIYDQVNEYMSSLEIREADVEMITLTLGGHRLGIAVGSLFAFGLIVATNWLVIRGTADQSYHAHLLGHYLPGYSVSFTGSLIGAVMLFVIVYIFCQILSLVYNKIVRLRVGRLSL